MPDPIPTQAMKQVTMLDQGELIIQLTSLSNASFACLTSTGRVLVPGKAFGEWFVVPTPPPFSPTE